MQTPDTTYFQCNPNIHNIFYIYIYIYGIFIEIYLNLKPLLLAIVSNPYRINFI